MLHHCSADDPPVLQAVPEPSRRHGGLMLRRRRHPREGLQGEARVHEVIPI